MHVVATAGHVDHGKSTLVRALTGMEPDRWAEERRRGMTIDLGFAWTTLPSGGAVAFVDVPGHSRFIANMLAGVGPVPAALFVVAADEGWRQQSTEHLAALDAFGVRHGLLAITRSDLADPGPALADAAARLRRSTLGRAAAVAVSGPTGAGLAELRLELDRLTAGLPTPDAAAPVRLWVDRSFTIRGAGTVVTGTLGAGTLGVGDELEVGAATVRVRGLESLQRRRERVGPVARVAVNLRGVDRDDVARGSALLTPGAWRLTGVVDARLTRPPADLPAELVLHVGSAAVPVRLRRLGIDTARLVLAHPLPLRLGDRVLLRDPSRHDRLAGATLLDVAPPALRRRGAAIARAEVLRSLDGRPDLASEVARRGAVRRSDLALLGAPPGDLPAGVTAAGEWLVSEARWREWIGAVRAAVVDHGKGHPLDPALPRDAVRHAAGLPDGALVEPLATAAGLVAEGGRWRPSGVHSTLPAAASAALDAVTRRLTADPFAAPEVAELAAAGLTPPVLAAAARAALLVTVGDGIWLLPDWAEEAVGRLAALPQPFTTSQARQALATTRRVAVPVLEALDAARRTRRLDGSHRTVISVG